MKHVSKLETSTRARLREVFMMYFGVGPHFSPHGELTPAFRGNARSDCDAT